MSHLLFLTCAPTDTRTWVLPRHWGSGLCLSSEYGTHQTVKARLWPWLSGKSHQHFQVVSSSRGSGGVAAYMLEMAVVAPPKSTST